MKRTHFVCITFIICGLMTVPLIPTSESVLWDLIIKVGLEKNPLELNDKAVVIGSVADHAGKPISEVNLKIRFGTESFETTTNDQGEFRYESEKSQVNPGRYIINVLGTAQDGRIGLASTDYQVRGNYLVSSELTQKLELFNASQYKFDSNGSPEGDPIKLKLYNYYQGIKEQIIEEQAKEKEIIQYQQFLNEQRDIAKDELQLAIEKEKPGAGVYSGYNYDEFVSNLNSDVKEIIVDQLNFTFNKYMEAKNAMNKVLENGGTYQEARQAYFEKVSITREIMDSMTTKQYDLQADDLAFDQNYTGPIALNEQWSNSSNINLQNTEDLTDEINVNGTLIKLGVHGTKVTLNVNGTIVEFVINGTEITQSVKGSQ